MIIACGGRDMSVQVPDVVDFNYHIKPLLSDRCFACHGPDEKAREAELSLHTESGAFAALEGSADMYIIAPGDPESSEVYHRIMSEDPEYVMPPPASNLSLTEQDKALIAKWIKQGAIWKEHWAFIPPQLPEVPQIKNEEWQKNPIDAFVRDKMKSKNLTPAAEEMPTRWLRRVYFDITGLPPDVETITSFSQNPTEEDYEMIVDKLLTSEAYGERMASIWLDLARYADSHGYQDDKPRSIWPWRDWVIKAFNDNMPYDEFVTNQLAGDLLPDATYDQILATAFNRNHAITQEGGVINEEYLTEYAADRVQTFATSFLGLTLQCARCHDHKYDPLSQEEYFELFGFFNNVDGERGQISYFDLAPTPSIEMQDEQHELYISAVKDKIKNIEGKLTRLPAEERELFQNWKHQGTDVNNVDIEGDLEAHYDLNDTSWTFKDLVSGESLARVNINLPPAIERPEKIPGHEQQALKFNGDNFLSVGDVGDFEHYQSFTLSLWAQHTSMPSEDLTILGRRVDEQYRQGYELALLKNRKLSFRLIHNVNDEQLEVQTLNKLSTQGWHHLAVTYDGSSKASGVKVFIDGKKQPSIVIRDDLNGLTILNG
ncbi:MAG: DUF1549 domain-containing protein, partial [Saprospiraceae bacterium]|nr:DUF1549 domain-containing protein [Saprospiraceae bacterium]